MNRSPDQKMNLSMFFEKHFIYLPVVVALSILCTSATKITYRRFAISLKQVDQVYSDQPIMVSLY